LESGKTKNVEAVQSSPLALEPPKYKPMSTDSGVRNSSNIYHTTQVLLTDAEDSANQSINGVNNIQTLVPEHVDQNIDFGNNENSVSENGSMDQMGEQIDGDLDIEFEADVEEEVEKAHDDSPKRISSGKKRRSNKRVSMSVNSMRKIYSKRMSQMVKMNRAFHLRKANMPSIGHNHASGVSYKLRSSKKSPPPTPIVRFEDTAQSTS